MFSKNRRVLGSVAGLAFALSAGCSAYTGNIDAGKRESIAYAADQIESSCQVNVGITLFKANQNSTTTPFPVLNAFVVFGNCTHTS